MNTMSMAFRNLGRNRRRSLLAMTSVFIAIFVAVFADGFVSGILDSMTRNATKNQTGHVNITTLEYRSRERFMPASAAIADSDAVVRAVAAMPELAGELALVEPRVQFGVVLSSPAGTKAALGIGGDPEKERSLLMLDRTILPGGAYLSGPGQAIVGWKLAEDLALALGDSLKVVTQKADFGLGFKKFRIVGIFRTQVDRFDSSTFQVGFEDARELLGLGRGASQVLVMLRNYKRSDAAAAAIARGLAAAGLEANFDSGAVARAPAAGGAAEVPAAPRAGPKSLSVRSWTSIGDVAVLISLAGGTYSYIELFITFLGAFIIANIMMMVVLERRREIGILKSMGMEKSRILALFLAEGTLLGAFGSAAGAMAGGVLNAVLGARGLDMSKLIGGTDYQMDNVIFPVVNSLHILGFFALGALVAAAIAYLPSRSAARMDPIEAIRSV
jgi:putative ABC transport system permease protein